MNDSDDLRQEARRRASSLSDQQWLAWLGYVEAHNGSLTLPFDGSAPFAEYPARARLRGTCAPQSTNS